MVVYTQDSLSTLVHACALHWRSLERPADVLQKFSKVADVDAREFLEQYKLEKYTPALYAFYYLAINGVGLRCEEISSLFFAARDPSRISAGATEFGRALRKYEYTLPKPVELTYGYRRVCSALLSRSRHEWRCSSAAMNYIAYFDRVGFDQLDFSAGHCARHRSAVRAGLWWTLSEALESSEKISHYFAKNGKSWPSRVAICKAVRVVDEKLRIACRLSRI